MDELFEFISEYAVPLTVGLILVVMLLGKFTGRASSGGLFQLVKAGKGGTAPEDLAYGKTARALESLEEEARLQAERRMELDERIGELKKAAPKPGSPITRL